MVWLFFMSYHDNLDIFLFPIGRLENHPTALLVRGAGAPYQHFANGKTLVQGEFILPEHFKNQRVAARTTKDVKS